MCLEQVVLLSGLVGTLFTPYNLCNQATVDGRNPAPHKKLGMTIPL